MEPTTFSALKTMERLGYVTRRQVGNNRKKVYVFLTPKGRKLKDRLVPLAEDVNSIAVRGLAPEHIAITRTVLLAIIENMARDEQTNDRPMPSTRAIARLAEQAGRKLANRG
jgi:DNA-binding MarR family transcriptional regulator